LVGRAVPCNHKFNLTPLKNCPKAFSAKKNRKYLYYLDALVTDKEEINVSGMSDFCVNHKSGRHIAVPISHLVLRVREEAGVVTLLHNQECDLRVVALVHSLDCIVNGSQLHLENLIGIGI
jgi:hypothetical protein